jgi:hypothetical protein
MGNSRRGFGVFTDTVKFPPIRLNHHHSIRDWYHAMDVIVAGSTHG